MQVTPTSVVFIQGGIPIERDQVLWRYHGKLKHMLDRIIGEDVGGTCFRCKSHGNLLTLTCERYARPDIGQKSPNINGELFFSKDS